MSVSLAAATGAAAQPPNVSREAEDDRGPQRLQLVDHNHLPLAFARSLLARAELTFHQLESLAYAYYEPAPPRLSVESEGPGGAEAELRPARISLQRGYFPSAVVAFAELTIDLAENLSFALLLGHLHEQVELRTESGVLMRERALESSQRGVASDDELAAWMTAVASYGSYLLSLANEIERAHRRIEARGGRDLCELIAERVGLLGLWERAVVAPFTGSAFDSRGREVPRRVAAADKQLLLDRVFGGVWSGDAMADFGGRYCRR